MKIYTLPHLTIRIHFYVLKLLTMRCGAKCYISNSLAKVCTLIVMRASATWVIVRTQIVTNLTVLGSHVKRPKQCHL